MSDAQRRFEEAVAARLRHLAKTAKLWGSPEELETVAQHLTHVWLVSRAGGGTFEETAALWRAHGAPFAGEAEVHAQLRTKLWGAEEERARTQVVEGYVVVWAELEREPEREARVGGWIEHLLDRPGVVGPPDLLDMVLFALMGFVASQPERFVELLARERTRVGGHPQRPLHLVAPRGPQVAGLAWTRTFTGFVRVAEGITAVVDKLEAGLGRAPS